MRVSIRAKICAFAGILVLSGCAQVKDAPPENSAKAPKECPADNNRSALAGSWLYEEQGYFYTLRLDKQGNGAYEWKDGRFLTSCLDKQHWRGAWEQAESEGGFEIKLSRDLTTGEGRRWYTQIGGEKKLGGQVSEFQVKRIGSVSQVSEPPAAVDDPLAGQEAARR
jgi:hypothetical protein